MSKWKTSQIKDFGRVITGYTPPTSNLKLWEGDIPFYSPTDFNDDVYCKKTERTINSSALSNDRIVQENSLMVTCIASIGKIALAKKQGITNQQINSILFNESFDPKYCYYLIKNNINELIKLGGTTAVPIVNKADFEKIHLRHHSDKTEQQRIARILSTADAVIEKTQAAIAKYKAIKQGMLQDLFTRGIDLNTNKLRPRFEDAPGLYKESKLGMIPREWDEDVLGNIISVSSGEGLTQENIKPGIHLIYGGNGINGSHSDYLFEDSKLIIGRVGEYCGNAYITKPFSWVTDNALVVTPLRKVFLMDFWQYYLNFLDLNSLAFVGAQPVITGGLINKVVIKEIPEDEQILIAKQLKAIDNKLQTEQTYLQKMQSLKKGLMEDLLSGKKQVKVSEPLIVTD